MLEAALLVLALSIRDLGSLPNVEIVFCLALQHGVMVLHPALVTHNGSCHMLCTLLVSRNAVTLVELLDRVVGQCHGHEQLEDRR